MTFLHQQSKCYDMFNEIILLSDACSHAPRFVQSYTLLPVSQLAVLLPELYGNIRGSSRGWCLLQNLRFREVYSLESLRFIGFYSLAKFTLQQSLLFSKVYSLAKFTLKQSLRFSEVNTFNSRNQYPDIVLDM